ncbi:hypothetical protein IW261DRAFT_1574068 [Armillaria novae-zelandiae]|uniref:Uncharacterized protein n=1 Tax=Armillaria novae-zelandiae TaxID=153914 RepID=A0AA39NL09_9AGAR|nr:hypothetical protein IW261DRAFT_1574068 [Armillaria novae-zelandiae]
MSTTQLIPALDAPLDDICYNLAQGRTVTVQYLEVTARNAAPTGELIRVVTQAHVYLDAHIDILQDFKFSDLVYGLALRLQVYIIASRIPMDLHRPIWKKWYLTDAEALHHEYALDDELLLPSEEGYKANGPGCIPETDLWPFRTLDLPPPRRPTATPSPKKTVVVPHKPTPPIPKRPRPQMIHTFILLRNSVSFSAPGRKLLGVLLPPAGSGLSGPTTCKHLHDQKVVTNTPIPVSHIRAEPMGERVSRKTDPKKLGGPSTVSRPKPRKAFRMSPVPNAFNLLRVAKKPQFSSSSESDIPPSSDDGDALATQKEPLFFPSDSDMISDVFIPPISKCARVESPAPKEPTFSPPRAYYPLTGELLPSLRFTPLSAPSVPTPPLPVEGLSMKAKGKQRATSLVSPRTSPAPGSAAKVVKKKPVPVPSTLLVASALTATVTGPSNVQGHCVDQTIYTRAFHPDVDVHFHEPPSQDALVRLKMSALPMAPTSLTKPVSQLRGGHKHIYWCHSDVNPYFIRPPTLNWPCFNCTLASFPDECIFEGDIGEERCTKCKANHHGPCSTHWDANQLHNAATLLDPLMLSGDGAIAWGLAQVEGINTQLKLLGQVVNKLRADWEVVISELVDGLDAIASCEHGTDIIDAYASVSGFLKLFIVQVGTSGVGSNGAGESGNGENVVESVGDTV